MQPRRSLPLAGIIALGLQSALMAALTTPSGYVTLTIKAGSFATPSTQFIAFGLSRPAVFQGTITAASTVTGAAGPATQLSFAVNTVAPGSYGATGGSPTHVAEILGGSGDGYSSPIASTLPDAVILSGVVPATSGTVSARIRPLWTVQELFSASNSAGFLAGADSTVADIIRILRPGATPIEIYYNNTRNRWETPAGALANSITVLPDAGLEVARRGTNEFTFTIAGEVKSGPSVFEVGGGSGDVVSYRPNLYPVSSVRLRDLGLYTGNPATGVRAGTSELTADVVTIQDPASGEKRQYFLDSASGRWKVGQTDASLAQIPANASITVTRRNGGAFAWTCPQPAMSLAESPLPLTLNAAASRKTHGSAGTWDVNLPLSGSAVGIESRYSGAARDFTIVLAFDGASAENPLVSGSAVVSSGSGSVVSTSFNNNEMLVNLTGVSNAQTTTLSVSSVTAQNGQSTAGQVKLGALQGDMNYNKSVTSADTTILRRMQGAALDVGNFTADINANGSITTADQTLSSRSQGTSLP